MDDHDYTLEDEQLIQLENEFPLGSWQVRTMSFREGSWDAFLRF